MAVFKKTLSFTSSLKLVRDTTSNATAENDVNGGAAVFYGIEVDNSLNSSAVYVKLYNNAGPTVGTTAPDITMKVSAGSTRRMMVAEGIAFATALSFATVTDGGGTAGTTNPTNSVVVSLLVA